MYERLSVRGDARSRGCQYGEQAASRVLRSIEAYQKVFEHYAGWNWEQVTDEAARFALPIQDFGIKYWEEIEGIAEGAGVPTVDILAINVRTEVMFAAKARSALARLPAVGECSAFIAVPPDDRPTLVGQNWDWLTHSLETTVLLEADPTDGPRFVTAVEAGLLAKTGFNSHGIGICTNALVADGDKGTPGVPYHVLLRSLLDARTPTEALATLQKAPRSSSGSYLIAHRDGLGLGVEATPGDFSELMFTEPDERGLILHTNHFRHRRMNAVDVGIWVMPDSVFRSQRLERDLRVSDPYDVATYERIMSDHAGHPSGVCCHPDAELPEPEQGTTAFCVVMDLAAMTMRFADGRPCENGFRTLDYAPFLSGGWGLE